MPCAIKYTFHLDLIGYLLHDLLISQIITALLKSMEPVYTS